jgi:acyl carrier protein
MMKENAEHVRARVEAILLSRFGRVEEQLILSGILDSLRTIEFALELEAEFQIELHHLTVQDTSTLTGLTTRLIELGAK